MSFVLAVPAFGLIIKTINNVPNTQFRKEVTSTQETSTVFVNSTRELLETETTRTDKPSLHQKPESSNVDSDTALLELPQTISIILPKNIPVDPRAHTIYLPNIIFVGDGLASVCIDAQAGKLDVSKKQSAENFIDDRNVSISGDESSRVILTGQVSDIQKVLNSFRGISYFNENNPVSNSRLQFLVTPLRKAVIPEYPCNPTAKEDWETVEFRPLGLTLGIVKSEIPLHAPR